MKPPRFCYRAVEFRSEASDGRTMEGYAAVFDTPTRIESWEGNFDEVIVRGAFGKTLAERRPVLQFDHGQDARTGSVPIGRIDELREDDRGLYVRAELYDNPVVEPIRQAIAGRSIDGMSFRFRVNNDKWTRRDNDVELRTIREVELYELGPVVFPAYDATTVGVRSLLAGLDEVERRSLIRELADMIRPHTSGEAVPEGTSAEPAEPAIQSHPSGTALAHKGLRHSYLRKGFVDATR